VLLKPSSLLITGAATEILVRSTYMMKAMMQSRMNVILALLRGGCEGDMSSSIHCYKAVRAARGAAP
jgi:hypothetical protein